MRSTFSQILRIVFFLTIPAAVGLFLLRVPIIQFLLERREFTAESTRMVAYALQFYALGLVAHSAVEITVRGFYAMHNTWTPVLVGVIAMSLNVALSLLWVGMLGHGGLALANTTATTLEMIALLWLINRLIGGLDKRSLSASVVRSVLATVVMAVGIWLWLDRLTGPSTAVYVTALGGLMLAVVVYLSASALLRSEELRDIWRLVPGSSRRGFTSK